MTHFLLPMPNGKMPTIQYLQDLRDAGVISPEIADRQITILKQIQYQQQLKIKKRQMAKQYLTNNLNQSN